MIVVPVRLNLGAGNKSFEGWTSVGLDENHDIRADLRDLSALPDGFADEAMAIHVLEHLHRWEAPAALREWRRVLKPGAKLVLELPDLVKCCRAVVAGRPPRDGLWGLFGDPGYSDPLMCHRWAWTSVELIKELKAAGFTGIKIKKPQFHGKRVNRDMRIEARA